MNNALNLAGRILLSLIFILSGWSKIGGYEATQGYMASMGVPGQLLPLVIALELLLHPRANLVLQPGVIRRGAEAPAL